MSTPPYDDGAEVAVIGALLLEGAPVDEIRTMVCAVDFYRPAHQATFTAIGSLHDRGEPTDPLAVVTELRRLQLDGLGTDGLIDHLGQAPLPRASVAYAQMVRDRAVERRALAVAAELTRAAQGGQLATVLPEVVQRLSELGVGSNAPTALIIEDIAVVADRAHGCVTRFLARPVWPGDAYGVLAAEKKVGKTWLALDLVVSVAAGGSWLGAYPIESPGPVLVFLGEGGQRKMNKRLQAIAEAKGVKLEKLPVRICCKAPNLTLEAHLGLLRQEVKHNPPVLVVIDPFYLSAPGAKSTDLYSMGQVLGGIQAICQEAGAALLIVTHWNKTGEGHGAHRMTGAGPAEWGRVLVSVGLDDLTTNPDRSTTAILRLTFEGDEIPETELLLRRRVWSDDPDDLASPLHYELTVLTGTSGSAKMRPADQRVLAALVANDDWLTVRAIGDVVARDGRFKPLTARCIQDSCAALDKAGLVRKSTPGGKAFAWRAHTPEAEAENAF